MKVISLQSGSNGNCIYVEADGSRLLIDAGIPGLTAERRLALRQRNIRDVDALLISHDHCDHTSCLGIYHRRYGFPVYMTERTYYAVNRKSPLGPLRELRHFHSGEVLDFGSVRVETIPTPHDAADGVVFVVDDGKRRVGIFTDLGHVFDRLEEVVDSLDAIVLESNYDPDMLERGPYPDQLKRRIRGPQGHLSNLEAAQFLAVTRGPRLRWACLAHLSHENNHPDVALATHRSFLGGQLPLFVASRHEATAVLEV